MDTQENATPNAMAENQGSAPEQTITAENQGSAPEQVPADENNSVNEGSESSSKAIKELISQRKKRQEAEREAAYWKGVAEGRVSTAPQHDPKPEVPAVLVAPNQDNFETYEEYENAREAYILAKAEQRITQRYEEQQRQQEEFSRLRTFEERMEAAAKEDPTILDIKNDQTLPVSMSMAEVIKMSEMAPDILRWIDQNRAEATRISRLPPFLAAKELGVVEAMLKNKPAPTPPPRVSAAPEPIKTVTPVGNTEIDEDKMPLEEWIKRRNEAQFKRR